MIIAALKNVVFIFLLFFSFINAKAMEGCAKNQALPAYAQFLSQTYREQFEYMMVNAMDVLGDQILHESGVSTTEITRKPFKDLIPEDFIPKNLDNEDEREAFKIIISHYAYLHQVRHILSAALSQEIPITGEEIVPKGWQKKEQEVPLFHQKHASSCYCVSKPEQKENNTTNEESLCTKTNSATYLTISMNYGWLNCPKYFYLENLFDEQDIRNIPVAESFSLKDITIAYQFLSSYSKIPFPGSFISDITEIMSAGTELKKALDIILGTKGLLSNPPSDIHSHLDYDKRRLSVLKKEVELSQNDSSEITFKPNQFIDFSEILKISSIFREREYEALKYAISLEEAGTSDTKEDKLELWEQALKRDTLLLTLKKASELFVSAFSEGEEERIRYIRKRFYGID